MKFKTIDKALARPNGNGVYVQSDGSSNRIVVIYRNGVLSDHLCCWKEDGAPFFVGNVVHSKTTKRAIYNFINKYI